MKNTLIITVILTLFLFTSSCAQETSKVIVFSKTEGYRHKSIEEGIKSIIKLGKENQFLVQSTEDANELIAALSSCKVVIFLNTTGNVLNNAQQEKFKAFIKNGGGFVGVHAATDTEYEWPWYGKMIGAYFESHPKQQEAIIEIIETKHLSTDFLKKKRTKFDEWYNFKNINPDVTVLMNLDESSYKGGKNGKNHPIAWFHKYEGGNIFYTGLGHTEESYKDATFLKHLSGGILYAMGRSKKD
jgi:type 1 glutamine amidotransferase